MVVEQASNLFSNCLFTSQLGSGGAFRQRRLLPAISISMAMFGLLGKAVTLLWQMWLMFGPSYSQMRAALLRVKALVVDFGTESGLPELRDILPAFFKFIKAPLPANYAIQQFLFPRAVLQPGMRHSVDRLIRKPLLGLPWFPSFLDGIKAIVSFVRDRRTDINASLRKAGHGALADLLDTIRLSPFAKWRWGTLASCASEVDKFIRSFALYVDLEPFRRRAQDPTLVRRVSRVLTSAEWYAGLRTHSSKQVQCIK